MAACVTCERIEAVENETRCELCAFILEPGPDGKSLIDRLSEGVTAFVIPRTCEVCNTDFAANLDSGGGGECAYCSAVRCADHHCGCTVEGGGNG